jgi:chromosome segregation ATPase
MSDDEAPMDLEGVERCEIVVDSNAVQQHSEDGYRTIEIREEDIATLQFVNNQEMAPGTNYYNQVTKQVSVVLRVLRFHMVREGASRIAELAVALEAVQAECAALKTKTVEGDKVIAALKTDLDMQARYANQHLLNLVNEKKIVADLREAALKMEATIAKIRKEIGEQRWREITADPSDQKGIAAEKARIASLDLDDAQARTP